MTISPSISHGVSDAGASGGSALVAESSDTGHVKQGDLGCLIPEAPNTTQTLRGGYYKTPPEVWQELPPADDLQHDRRTEYRKRYNDYWRKKNPGYMKAYHRMKKIQEGK